MNYLAGQHVLVLGLGASGLALARWCVRCGAQVTVADTRAAPPQLAALQAELPAAVFVHADMDEALFNSTAFDLVVKSPGLSPASVAGVMGAAEARGTARGNELSLFAQALADLKTDRGYAPHVLAITGTNGKTTVTSLTGQLVSKAGKTVAVAGNIGPTLLDTLAEKLDIALAAQVEAAALADLEAAEAAALAALAPAPVEVIAPDLEDDADAQLPLDVEPNSVMGEDDATGTDPVDGDDAPAVRGDAGNEAAQFVEQGEDVTLTQFAPPPAPEPTRLPALPAMPEVWVLELSSFQLDGISNFQPTVATILNITQDHLDWHGDFSAYVAAKQRIFGKGLMFLNRDDAGVMASLPKVVPVTKGKQPPPRPYLSFGGDVPTRPGDYGIETINGMAWLARAAEADETIKRRRDEEVVVYVQRLMPLDALRIRGRHNATNALAALGLAVAAGCTLAPMLHALRDYRGEPHRVESIAVIQDIEYFDDSKGTNVGATVAALLGLGAERRLVVILGGEGKGQDFSPLADPVARHARAVVLIGRDAPLIRAALEDCGVPLIDGCAATFDCRAWSTVDAGDHVIILGEVLRYTHTDAAPLVFHGGSYLQWPQALRA